MSKTKYLWAAALLALCLAAASGAAFAQDWAVSDSDLPGDLVVGDDYDCSVTVENSSGVKWNAAENDPATDYALASVEGATGAASKIDRWGLTMARIEGVSVPDGEEHEFAFTVDTPPGWITYAYSGAAATTDPPVDATFDCNWMMDELGVGLMTDDTAEGDAGISTFPDIAVGFWSRPQIEQCANRAPVIIQGYNDDNYWAEFDISRAAMAVFVARGAMLDTEDPPETPTFEDVPDWSWAYGSVEACADAGIVLGYPDGLYRPAVYISRDQMAVYIQRAAGFATEAVSADLFLDVATDHWAAPSIKACVSNDVVYGYPDGLFRPGLLVDRGQMAVFVYRGLMVPTGNYVVVGGPGITTADAVTAEGVVYPSTANALDYYGFSEASAVDGGEYAYIALDGKHLGAGDVTFTTWAADADRVGDAEADPPVPADSPEDTQDFTLNAATAASAVAETGIPYVIVAYEIPGGLDADTDYAVAIDLPNGEALEIEFTTPE